MSADKKPHLSLVVMGNVDSGKSTTVGHLLYKVGCVDEQTMQKHAVMAAEYGKASFKYAWIMDKLRQERERGLSVECSSMRMETLHRVLSINDCPGHRDFVKNLITGATHADAALLVVSAAVGEFEQGVVRDRGVTRNHALLAFSYGMKHLVVAVNKMDQTAPTPHAEARFNEIKKELGHYLKKVGFHEDKVVFVPVSGFYGDNLLARSSAMPWYSGPTLLEALDGIEPPVRLTDKPLRIPVQQVFHLRGVGTVVTGRVDMGTIKVNDKVTISPGNVTTEVKSIEIHHQSKEFATAGDQVGLCLKPVDNLVIHRGSVISHTDDDPAMEAESFVAQVVILNHPGHITPGYTPVVDCGTAHIAVRFAEILSRIDRQTGKELEKSPAKVDSGDACMIKMVPTKPMSVEAFNEYPSLGRFSIRDMSTTVGIGIIKQVNKRPGGRSGAKAAGNPTK